MSKSKKLSELEKLSKEELISLLQFQQQELQEAREYMWEKEVFEKLFEESPDALFLTDTDKYAIRLCNKAAARLFEMDSKEDFKGNFGHHFHKTPFTEDHIAQVQVALDNNEEWSSEFEYYTKKKNEFWGHFSTRRLYAQGERYQVVRLSDITSRIRAEQRVAEAENMLKQCLDHLPYAFVIYDADLRYMFVNETIIHRMGKKRHEFMGKTDPELFPEAFYGYFYPALQQVRDTKKPFTTELDEVTWNDGLKHAVLLDYIPVLHNDGSIRHILGIIRDVSEQRTAEQALRKSNEDLKRANSELDGFMYRVSHDLKSPLNSVLGLTELMKGTATDPEMLHYIDLQIDSLHRLENFIGDIIQLSRNSRTGLQREKIDFDQLVKEVYEVQQFDEGYRHIARQQQIEQHGTFISDRTRLKVVLNNLVSNALKYSLDNRQEAFVSVKITADMQTVTITVADNGQGIADGHLEKIFQMFYRATGNKPGSGIGLYLVKECIDKMKGHIQVTSGVNKGSVFTVTLPNLL